MKVRDVMTAPAATITADRTCHDAAREMRAHRTGMLVVVTPQQLLEGVITDRDLVTGCMAQALDATTEPVGPFCQRRPVHVDVDADLDRAIEAMRNARVRRVPAVDASMRVVGVLSAEDIAVDVKHYVDAFLAVSGQYARSR